MPIAGRWFLLTASLMAFAMAASDPSPAGLAARIAAVERRMPWLWSSAVEGLADVPYTYEVRMTRRVWTRSHKEVRPAPGADPLSAWRDLQLERIPLDWGAFMRCLSENGASPCSGQWVHELERQAKRRDSLTPEERAQIDATRETRRLRRRAFWDDFPSALHFETSGPNQLRFSPLPGYKPQHASPHTILTAISGLLSFDPVTYEITRLEYDLTRDVDEPFARLPKGSHFEIELTRLPDGHYLPQRIRGRRRRGKTDIEDGTSEFSKFRAFESESKIQFIDPKDPGKD